jgi:hypothetical protein
LGEGEVQKVNLFLTEVWGKLLSSKGGISACFGLELNYPKVKTPNKFHARFYFPLGDTVPLLQLVPGHVF